MIEKNWMEKAWHLVGSMLMGIGGGIAVIATIFYHNPIVAQMGLVYLLLGWNGITYLEVRKLAKRRVPYHEHEVTTDAQEEHVPL